VAALSAASDLTRGHPPARRCHDIAAAPELPAVVLPFLE